ncbi:nuclear transport factor 2 family protein [Sphingomonas sp. MG17]|uniref:Nuclear transport factor 2 family protein n=1 Tax=Sphingomonas tagetis TaxID=2949092 RepID=A0A9X2KMP2_9SPHN|nr:nuclear transport factor 2 family protein [Sphingomonas tagetis]MCP3731892.1 nuclear transport factor 2 family protein [Sphingomonas tagetis]
MDDHEQIAAILTRYEQAVLDRDVDAVFADYIPNPVAYDLAPPLETRGAAVLDREGLKTWLDSWDGPVRVTSQEPAILVDGDLGILFTLQHMTGTKKGEGETDLWFRCTVALRRIAGAWKIVHIHTSVPMAMDGSGKAETGLKPA